MKGGKGAVMCLLSCRLKLDNREPTGLVCHHHAPTDAYIDRRMCPCAQGYH